MSRRHDDALQTALESLARGQDPEAALADLSPAEAAEVRALLATASLLRREEIPAGAPERSRSRFLRHAAGLRAAASAPARRLVPRFAFATLAALLALALGLGGLTEATARSLPGDPLYRVRQAAEGLRLRLAASPADLIRLEAIYAEQHVQDVRRLLELGRVVPVSFSGSLRSMGAVLWDVEGIPVRLTPKTRILGEILPGMWIEIEGVTQVDGTVLAAEVHLQAYDTVGTLEAMDASQMTVGGVSLLLTPQSYVEPGLALGQRILVRVAIDDDATRRVISAIRFEPPTPTPRPTEPPPPTDTPEPTATEDRHGPSTASPRPEDEPDDEGTETPEPDEDDDDPVKIEFEGVVQSISGSVWVVDGRTLRVDGGTEIKDNPQVGDTVKVVAFQQPDGSWWAEKIERED